MPTLQRALCIGVFAIATAVVIVTSYSASRAGENAPAATYSQGTLRVTLPYLAARQGTGQLVVDILDPEDNSVGHTEKRVRAKYPIRARTFPSRVYEYYEPEVNAVARPMQLEVRKK